MSNKTIRLERVIDRNYKLPREISTRLDYVGLVLAICRLLVNDDKKYVPSINEKERVVKPFLRIVEEDKRCRAYVFLARDKFFSIYFPYKLHVDKVSGVVSIYYDICKKMDDATLSECITFKEEMTDVVHENGDVEKGKTYNEVVLDGEFSASTNLIMSLLMTVEPSYVRYDHDLKSKNAKVHPIDHMDVNFNKLATFKLGLKGRVSPDKFESYLSPNTKSLFCNEGSPYYYVNRPKSLKDLRKKRFRKR